jgi:hypothetical protein
MFRPFWLVYTLLICCMSTTAFAQTVSPPLALGPLLSICNGVAGVVASGQDLTCQGVGFVFDRANATVYLCEANYLLKFGPNGVFVSNSTNVPCGKYVQATTASGQFDFAMTPQVSLGTNQTGHSFIAAINQQSRQISFCFFIPLLDIGGHPTTSYNDCGTGTIP